MAKKPPVKRCGWCGTKILRESCPRGKQCSIDQSYHDSLLARAKAKK